MVGKHAPEYSTKAAYEAFEALPAPQQPHLRPRLLYHEQDDYLTYTRSNTSHSQTNASGWLSQSVM